MTPKVVSFHYTLKDQSGNVLESSHDGDAYSYLEGTGQIIPGLEQALSGLKAGDKKSVHVPSAQAYGEYDENLVVQVPRDQMPEGDIKVGDRFHAESNDGQGRIVTVTAVDTASITVDGNHPLSGQDLNFDVEVTEVRDATNDELSHGHAHGPGGHDH